MKDIYSIFSSDKSIQIHIGETVISGVPDMKSAEKFVAIAKKRWPHGEEILNDSNTVGLIGSILIDALIAELS